MAKNVVSFRLDPVHLDLLKQRAGTAASMGAYARELVIRALNDQVLQDAIDFRLQAIQSDLVRLRQDAKSDHASLRQAIQSDQARHRQDIRMTLKAIVAAAQRSSLSAEQIDEYVNRLLG